MLGGSLHMLDWVGSFDLKKTAAALLLVAASVLSATGAKAVSFTPCSGTVAIAVSPNAGCTAIVGPANDDAGVMNTAPGAFGITDWHFIGRDNAQPETGDIDIWSGGTWLSGTFSFDAALTAGFSSVALVLKSAASANPCAVIGYLLQPGQTSGSFSSPFLCQQGSQQEISHFTLYGSTSPVPLPAAAPLLGGALALLGAAGWRRRRKLAAPAG